MLIMHALDIEKDFKYLYLVDCSCQIHDRNINQLPAIVVIFFMTSVNDDKDDCTLFNPIWAAHTSKFVLLRLGMTYI